jgi:hypothetical protein
VWQYSTVIHISLTTFNLPVILWRVAHNRIDQHGPHQTAEKVHQHGPAASTSGKVISFTSGMFALKFQMKIFTDARCRTDNMLVSRHNLLRDGNGLSDKSRRKRKYATFIKLNKPYDHSPGKVK